MKAHHDGEAMTKNRSLIVPAVVLGLVLLALAALYFACEDVDATVAQAGELGARTIMPASDVPNGGRFAILGDPSNAVFSVVSGPMDE